MTFPTRARRPTVRRRTAPSRSQDDAAPGFSAHVGEPIAPTDKLRLADTAAYLVRNPLSLKKLVHLDDSRAVLCRSGMNPSPGRNFEALDPLEWRRPQLP